MTCRAMDVRERDTDILFLHRVRCRARCRCRAQCPRRAWRTSFGILERRGRCTAAQLSTAGVDCLGNWFPDDATSPIECKQNKSPQSSRSVIAAAALTCLAPSSLGAQVVAGSAAKSYGIHVARLAGMPPQVVARAERVLQLLTASERHRPESLVTRIASRGGGGGGGGGDDGGGGGILAGLRAVDVDALSSAEARLLLRRLQASVRETTSRESNTSASVATDSDS